MHLLNNMLRQDLKLLTKIVTNTRLFLVLIQKNIDVEIAPQSETELYINQIY